MGVATPRHTEPEGREKESRAKGPPGLIWQAFFWTHEISDGYLMVVDLQGVRNPDGGFTLTDPVVLCTDLSRFSSTNLGTEAIAKCSASAKQHLAESAAAAQ